MTSTPASSAPRRPADDLERLATETSRLLTTVRGLDDDEVAAPSRCAGWSRGHVVTHLARNADALWRLTRVALTGEHHAMYPSTAARDAEIEAGAGRSAAAQLADLERSSERFAAYARHLAEEDDWLGEVPVTMRAGRVAPASELPFLRLREVVIHHVDLGCGFGFADVPPPVLRDLLGVEHRRLAGQGVLVHLVVDDDVPGPCGDGDPTGAAPGPVVHGTASALLAWTTRGHTDGVRGDGGPLPILPGGG